VRLNSLGSEEEESLDTGRRFTEADSRHRLSLINLVLALAADAGRYAANRLGCAESPWTIPQTVVSSRRAVTTESEYRL
jgi:hypothetical protein